jgi:hypothetical protein
MRARCYITVLCLVTLLGAVSAPDIAVPSPAEARVDPACIAVDPPLLLLSTVPGHTTGTVHATITDCAGNAVQVPEGALHWFGTTDAVLVDPDTGQVTVNYVPDSSDAGHYWSQAPQIRAALSDRPFHLTNWAFVVITTQDLTSQMDEYQRWTDNNVSFYFPPQAFGVDFLTDYTTHDIVHLTDLAFQINTTEVFGHRPHFGGPEVFALTPGVEEGTPCGINGAPVLLGIPAEIPENNCAAARHVGVIWHEMAHNITLDTEANTHYYRLWVADDAIGVYIEGIASWGGIYATNRLLSVCNYLGMSAAARANLEAASTSADWVRTYSVGQLEDYEAAGSPFENITPDHMDGILMRLTDEYGWMFFPKAMSVLRTGTPFEHYVNEAISRGLTARHTLMIAALSAGAGEDLRPLFRGWNFPIDDAFFEIAYADFLPYAAAFDPPLTLPEPLELHVFDPAYAPERSVSINGVVLPRGYSTVTRIEWDWGDGTIEDSWFPASHQYAAAGEYTVTVTPYDNQGNRVSQSTTVTFLPPSGCFPNDAVPGTVICLSG